uniref:Uncharacterized protein n=1 Tax=Leptobrachium leishanense TaxID=445787 RepID=A0A8C5Q4D7_9ANUR
MIWSELPVMATSDLKDELTCSICADLYKDPVTLICGHSFCHECITTAWDTQEVRGYSCPECRHRIRNKPNLRKNLRLCNIVECFRLAHSKQAAAEILCTYCEDPVPAAKTCLHCEVSLCDKHLRKHNGTVEHVLLDPTTSLGNRKCSTHRQVLEYFCCEDAAYICVYCRLDGEHLGHQVKSLNEASEKKKGKLRDILQKLSTEKEQVEKRVRSLQVISRETQEKLDTLKKQATDVFVNIRSKLETLEEELMSEISRQTQKIPQEIQVLERKKEELCRKMGHIEELCDMMDPVIVLQDQDSDRADYCDAEEGDNAGTERRDVKVVESLQLNNLIMALKRYIPKLAAAVQSCLRAPDASDLLLGINMASEMILDVNTASNYVYVSRDLKTVLSSTKIEGRPETPERFYYPQVLSSSSFSSGRHYWDMEVSETGWWIVGVAYPSIEKTGHQSGIGNNNKSWGLWKSKNGYAVRHDNTAIQFPQPSTCQRLGILLDYEAGRLSFYELCDSIKHIHTFTAVFTEPLYAVFGTFVVLEEPRKQTLESQIAWVRIRCQQN